MIRIGDKSLVYSQTFILLDNEEAIVEIDFPSESGRLTMSIRFLPEGGPGVASWKMEDGIMKLVFQGWRSKFGASIAKPVAIGDIGGEKIGFNVAQHLIGDNVNVLTLQFYLGGKYE